ncbi:MAG TPA: ATP-binding protein [Syntrophorhabdaceae bacterium]|nr:ATP-binding protein [Syntrophorhabdaceae bacterium]
MTLDEFAWLPGVERLYLCSKTPSCREERLVFIKKAIRQRDLEHPEIVLESAGVPKRFLKCSFENFQGNERIVGICKNHSIDQGLYLFGDVGRGKTHLIAAMLREFVRLGYHEFLFVSSVKLLNDLAGAAFRHDERDGDESEIINRCLNAGILVLDDLGKGGFSNWAITKLFLIIDQRYSAERPTIVTSNFDLEGIQDRLGEPIASRLAESRIIHITGSDYRKRRVAS